jgi:hypothetical protein
LILRDCWLAKTGALARDFNRLGAKIASMILAGGIYDILSTYGTATKFWTDPHNRDIRRNVLRMTLSAVRDSFPLTGQGPQTTMVFVCLVKRVT